MNIRTKLAAVLVAVVAVAGCRGAAPEQPVEQSPPPTEQGEVVDARRSVWSDLYERVQPSLVQIHLPSSSGTGFVVHEAGYVITNCHVLHRFGASAEEDAMASLSFADGRRYGVHGVAWLPLLDIALAKIESDETFVPLACGRSLDVQVGDPVAVFGHPMGMSYSITTGKVYLLGVLEADYTRFGSGAIQLDAGTNGGNRPVSRRDTET